MQEWRFSRILFHLAVMVVVAVSLTLVGCDDDDDSATTTEVALGAGNAAVLNNQTLTLPGGAFGTANNVDLTFTGITGANGSFSATSGGSTASGTVVFASCDFTVTASTFASGEGPQVGDVLTFPTCDLEINQAVNFGATGTGTIILRLINDAGTFESEASDVEITIEDDGSILVDDIASGATVPTGVTGSTGG